MSDCYVGLDIEKEVKYEIKAAKKDKIDANSHDDHQLDEEDGSLFSRWMRSVMPQ